MLSFGKVQYETANRLLSVKKGGINLNVVPTLSSASNKHSSSCWREKNDWSFL